MNTIYSKINDILKERGSCALCTVVSTSGSTPMKAGAKMIVCDNRDIVGTIGGGDLEKKVIENAIEVIIQKKSEQFNHNLLQQHAMCCGGKVTIFIDYIQRAERLYVFGAGHVGRALSTLASALNFEVFVIDERRSEMNKLIPSDINKIQMSYKDILPTLPFDENTYTAIMTRDHAMDREILSFCIEKQNAYIGMIGSKRKVEITKKMFVSGGICTEQKFNEIDTPMGIDINAHSPEEIAVSILARMIMIKNKTKAKKSSITHQLLSRESL
ncbi:MAG: XdhC family protein [Sphingobacteriaceae bacterium]|nr:XdhC family protein [Sphingobacteriaceae bacterium]